MEFNMPMKKMCATLFNAFFLMFIIMVAGHNVSLYLSGQNRDPVAAPQEDDFDIEQAYLDARFSELAEHLSKKDYAKLSLREKLLLIECRARTAGGTPLLKNMKTLLSRHKASSDILTTAGILYTSLGRLIEARNFINRALDMDKESPRALLAQAMLHLYFQKYSEAESFALKLADKHPDWRQTNLYLFAGIEIFKGSRNPQKLKEIYDLLAKKSKKNDKRYYKNFKANSRFLKKVKKGGLFDVETLSDRVELPLAVASPADEAKKTIYLKVKDKSFRVLVDTGNAVGWFVYSSELKEMLKVTKGGRAFTRLGIEDASLEGHHIFCKSVDFGDFKMTHLAGQFLAKPHPDFYDANLNPVFIRNRVVTLDFIRRQMVLTTKERFDKELAARQGVSMMKLPWYGYERAFIPVTVNGAAGLAMIETGAEDVALNLDFATVLQLPLKEKKRFLANGKVFHFHTTPVKVSAGKFSFQRENAEVWPLNRIYNPISGVAADVIIGPEVLHKQFVVSFDPFERKIILEYGL